MITPRLRCILNYAQGKTIADIGTDHAYIPIALINEKRAAKVIASDINCGPLEAAKHNIDEHRLSSKIETRLGPGLSILNPGEADQIIIAGMGGSLIEEIIKNSINTARAAELLLQPMNAQYELRKYLIENGFSIIAEDIAVEGFKVYNFIKAVSGRQQAFEKDIYYHIPPYLKTNPLYDKLYAKKVREFTKVIRGLEMSANTDFIKLEKYKQWYKELLKMQI